MGQTLSLRLDAISFPFSPSLVEPPSTNDMAIKSQQTTSAMPAPNISSGSSPTQGSLEPSSDTSKVPSSSSTTTPPSQSLYSHLADFFNQNRTVGARYDVLLRAMGFDLEKPAPPLVAITSSFAFFAALTFWFGFLVHLRDSPADTDRSLYAYTLAGLVVGWF